MPDSPTRSRRRPNPERDAAHAPQTDPPLQRPAEAYHWLLWLVAILPACWRQITTSDCWWHVALGRWLVEHRSLPDYGIFYFTPVHRQVPDLRWTALGDIVFYFANALGGSVALQLLSFGCLVLGCVLLRKIYPGPMNGWLTALLAAVALGTYQLQLPRNAIFSLPLIALLLLLFVRYRSTRRWTYAATLPVLIGFWSVLHASALLALVLTALLLGVDVLEGFRDSWREALVRRGRVAGLVLAAALALVTIGNPTALGLLRRPIDSAFQISHPKTPSSAKPAPAAKISAATPKLVPPAPRNLKEWLNNLIWPVTPGEIRSGDFASPLDRLEYRPVGVAFLLMALAGVWIVWTRSLPLPLVATYLATTVLGLSYFRMTGYAAIGSAALLLGSGRGRGRIAEALGKSSWLGGALVGVLALVLWVGTLSGGLTSLIGNARHVFGLGEVATFDAAATAWVLEKHPGAPTFTTIVTGSYALDQWRWKKPVFIDGFFSPHRAAVWTDYAKARDADGRDLLRDHYRIDVALVEHPRQDWNGLFLAHPDWQPAAIGTGCIVYAHRSILGDAPPVLLFGPGVAEKLPPYYRRALARNYYGALLALLAADRTAAAQSLVSSNPQAYLQWRKGLSGPEKAAVRQMDPILRPEASESVR